MSGTVGVRNGALAFAALFASVAAASAAPPGQVVGFIDAVQYGSDGQYYVSGWACQQGNRNSIDVHVYAGHPAGAGGTLVVVGRADIGNEPAVDRECHDADGGKHRFHIALPNQLLRTFQKKNLYVHGIALAGNVENAAIFRSGQLQLPAPKWPPDPPTPAFLDGAPVAAFDTRHDSCEETDIPDAPARAFRDYKGTVHLVASHLVTRASIGPTLEAARHNCNVVYRSAKNGNPAAFDDSTWLTNFYPIDGKQVVALGHMEYHGWDHPGMCATRSDTPTCWYNAETYLKSSDGGYHFSAPKYLLGFPYKYELNKGPEGYSVDTNILKVGEWFYATAYAWAWPPGCGGGKGQSPCLVPDATCPIRTANVLDPASWRGWDGKDFTVAFADPYRTPIANPKAHICVPVPYLDYSNGTSFHEAGRLFVATLWNQGSGDFGPRGVYFTTSPDFIHWSTPHLALTLDQMLRREPEGNWSYGYFSLIDPNAKDPNFSTITDHPYLYYVRMDGNHPPYQRVLFRQKIKLDWLIKAAAAAPRP